MRRQSRVSCLWLAIFAVSFVFVLSFIFFEVLDVDGSDFPISPSNMAVKLVEPPHDDFKRGLIQRAPDLVTTGATSLGAALVTRPLDAPVAPRQGQPHPLRRDRTTLPRSALADPSADA